MSNHLVRRARTHHYSQTTTSNRAKGVQVVHVERAQVDKVVAFVKGEFDFFAFCFFVFFVFLVRRQKQISPARLLHSFSLPMPTTTTPYNKTPLT